MQRSPSAALRLWPILSATALFLFTALGASAATSWWNADWKARREINLRGARSSSHAPLVAYVRFRDFVAMKPDASDVRVVDDRGEPVPFHVVFYHPRVDCVVSLEPPRTTWRGYVYYGNPKAPPPQNDWRPQSGLLMTTYRRKGDGCNRWEEMEATVRASRDSPDGAGFRPSIFDGFNPFGASENFVSVYDGWFFAPRTGTFQFSTISASASFVFIDGKLVVQWPGRHGAGGGRYGEHKGAIHLETGPHHVQYYHLQFTGQTVAELAWWLPGEQRPELMPPTAYLPVWEAEVGLEEHEEEAVRLEFSAVPVQTFACGDHHYIQWKFGNMSGVAGSPAKASRWDFGNGLTSSERNPLVWYFRPGDYEVMLTTTLGSGETREIRRWVRVADLIQLDVSDKPDALDRAARGMAGYPIAGLVEADREAVLALLRDREMNDAIESLCRQWLESVYAGKGAVPVNAVLERGRVLSEVRGDHAAAESVYETAARRMGTGPEAWAVQLALGELRTRKLGKHDAAIAALQAAGKGLPSNARSAQRGIAIALGDAYRAKLDRPAAEKEYKRAEDLRERSSLDVSLRSSYGLKVEAFLDREDYATAKETLAEWADRFPTDKIDGYWSLLMGRCLFRMDRKEDAAAELALAAKLNPYGNYTADVLEQLGYSYAWLRRYDEAKKALRAAADLFDDPTRKKHIEQQITLVEREARQFR